MLPPRVVLSSAAALLAAVLAAPAAAQDPADPYYEFLNARRLESAGDVEGALAALQRAAAADRGSAEIRAEMAALHLRHNRTAEAEAAAREALGLEPDNIEAHRVLGLVEATRSDAAMDARQSTQAVAAARAAVQHLEAVATSPVADINLQYTLGRLYMRAGAPEKAVQALTRVLNQNPESVQGRLALAQAYASSNNLPGAIDTLQDIVDDEPRVASTLAQYQEQAGQLRAAAENYARALTVTPRSRELKFRRAATLYQAKEYAKAAEIAAQAQAEHPEDTRFVRLQARALFDGGSPDRALTLLETTMKAFPRDVETQFLLADLYSDSDRLQDAERTLRQLLQIDPTNADALNYLGYILADRGPNTKLDEAIQLVERALQVDPDNPSYLDSLGWAHFRRGNIVQAERYLAPAAEKLPKNSVIQDHLGDLHARRGRWQEAINAWTRAMDGDGQVPRDVLEKKIREARARLGR